MRYLIAALLLAACSTTTVTATPSTDATDARICEAALQVPWNSAIITPLTRDPATPIQEQARNVQELFDTSESAGTLDEWHTLSGMCIDAGY